MNSRLELLAEIFDFPESFSELWKQLWRFPWDYSWGKALLTKDAIISALTKGAEKNLYRELEDWANIIECREDVRYETPKVEQSIFELANPVLYWEINNQKVQELLLDM